MGVRFRPPACQDKPAEDHNKDPTDDDTEGQIKEAIMTFLKKSEAAVKLQRFYRRQARKEYVQGTEVIKIRVPLLSGFGYIYMTTAPHITIGTIHADVAGVLNIEGSSFRLLLCNKDLSIEGWRRYQEYKPSVQSRGWIDFAPKLAGGGKATTVVKGVNKKTKLANNAEAIKELAKSLTKSKGDQVLAGINEKLKQMLTKSAAKMNYTADLFNQLEVESLSAIIRYFGGTGNVDAKMKFLAKQVFLKEFELVEAKTEELSAAKSAMETVFMHMAMKDWLLDNGMWNIKAVQELIGQIFADKSGEGMSDLDGLSAAFTAMSTK